MVRPRSVDDADLVQQAMMLFWKQGFASTGIRDLEQHLGIKAPSIYNRFGSKDALYRTALAHYLEVIVEWRIQNYLVNQPPLKGLRRFFDTTYNYIDAEHPPLSCFLVTTSLELGSDDPLVTDILQDGANRLRTGFREHLMRAQSEGLLARDLNLTAWVELLHLSLQGLLVTSKVAKNRRHLKQKVDAIFDLLTKPTNTKKDSLSSNNIN